MKRLTLLLPILVLLFVSCQEEEIFTSKKQLRFSVPVDLAAVDGSIFTAEVTLNDMLGNPILENSKIVLTQIGGRWVTDAVSIPEGKYEITEFLVSDGEQVLYALPKKNSVLASETNIHSLQFATQDLQGDDVTISVLSVDGRRVQDFGYAPGKFKTYSFKLSVSITDSERLLLTNATSYIQSDDGESYIYDLKATVNTVTFAGDPKKTYKLRIWKDGFQEYSKSFVYQQLRSELKGKPWEVTLKKSATTATSAITIQPSGTDFSILLEVMNEGTIVLDWGNGQKESLMFNADADDMTGSGYFVRSRQYAAAATPVRLTGDLHLITALYFDTPIASADVRYAIALKGISFTDCALTTLDLTSNKNLEWFSFFGSSVATLKLPAQHAVRNVMIESNGTWPSAAQLDYIIGNVHANAVTKNFRSGFLSLSVNQVSASAKSMLAKLKSDYAWEVVY